MVKGLLATGGVAVSANRDRNHTCRGPFSSVLLKFSFRGLPVKSDATAKAEQVHHAPADVK